MAAGAATGVLKAVLLHPFDLAHTRLAADAAQKEQPRLYTGLVRCLLQTGRSEGWRALWKGVIASSLGTMPYTATSFTVSLKTPPLNLGQYLRLLLPDSCLLLAYPLHQ